MEIDAPQSLTRIASQGNTITRGISGNQQVYRHAFNIEIRTPLNQRVPDVEILRTARTRIRLDQQHSAAPPHVYGSQGPTRRCLVRIIIDTTSQNREEALVDADWRLGYMVEMTEDGMGWFPGLPWVHDHFEVRLIYP